MGKLQARLHLIVTIASYGCDINARDGDGNTALHCAVSKADLDMSRLLLCLGADPNVVNKAGDSSRHLAARLKQSVFSLEERSCRDKLVRSLMICGAQRCALDKIGCVSQCVNEDSRVIRKSLLEEEKAASLDDFFHEYEETHPVRDLSQKVLLPLRDLQVIYAKTVERLEAMLREGQSNESSVNLLSLDGGGIRGLVIIQAFLLLGHSFQTLLEIEKELGEPAFQYFDWVAGTSTGALLAVALSQEKSARECQHIYLRFKDYIFGGWDPAKSSTVLETYLQEEVGLDDLSSIPFPRFGVPATQCQNNDLHREGGLHPCEAGVDAQLSTAAFGRRQRATRL